MAFIATSTPNSSTTSCVETITLPDGVMSWFASIPDHLKSDIIAKAMCEHYENRATRDELLQWLVDMDHKTAYDDYGVEMVVLHPASIMLTDDPDKLPPQILSLLDNEVSYTNFDICVDDNEQFWSDPKSHVHLETGLDATGRTYITGADLESYTIGDCLKMGRYEMTDMSLWFAVPKHLFPCLM
jgi:hypothetical protein